MLMITVAALIYFGGITMICVSISSDMSRRASLGLIVSGVTTTMFGSIAIGISMIGTRGG